MSQSFVCLFNGVWVGIPQTGLTPLHFMGLSQVRNLFGNGPFSSCFVYIIWIWDVFVRWVVVLHKICNFLLKGPTRACRRVRVYSQHWWLGSALFLFFYCCWLGVVASSFFLLFYVTAAIFNRYFPCQNVDRMQIAQWNDFSSRKTRFLNLPTIYTPILTDNLPILLTMDNSMAAKVKIGHVTSSAFQSFSGFIIALRKIIYMRSSYFGAL